MLDDMTGFVLCGCQRPWMCDDPDTISRDLRKPAKKQRRRPQPPGGLFLDRV